MDIVTGILSVLCMVIIIIIWKLMDWVWLKPVRLQRCLREQGFKGNDYRLFSGDSKQNITAMNEAYDKPANISDNIISRVIPQIFHTIKDHGKDSFNWNGPIPRLIIKSPKLAKEIFMRIGEFKKTSENELLHFLLTGLAIHEGDKWAKHRRIINPAFRLEKLKLMVPAFHESCVDMISKWENLIDKNGQNRSIEINVWPYLQSLTGDVISRTSFGSSFEEGKRIFELIFEQETVVLKEIHGINIPGWRYIPTKLNRRIKQISRDIEALVKNMIQKREEAINSGKPLNNDLLSILMESNRKEIKENDNNKSLGMSAQDIVDECRFFYLAGQRTTAVLLVWTMVLLSRFPKWQSRAREEVLQIFGTNEPKFDGIAQMKVMTMILNEVLRLYPPVPLTSRVFEKNTTLGNLFLPTGIEILVPIILLHYDPEIWGEDVNEFNPERFANGVSNAMKGSVNSYFPFGDGPRVCLGNNFSLIESKITLALILQHFDFELSPSYTHAPVTMAAIQPLHGAHFILRRRSS